MWTGWCPYTSADVHATRGLDDLPGALMAGTVRLHLARFPPSLKEAPPSIGSPTLPGVLPIRNR